MSHLLILLPFFSFIALFIFFASRPLEDRDINGDFYKAFIYSAVLWGVAVVVISEGLSLFNQLTSTAVAISWGVILAVNTGFIWSVDGFRKFWARSMGYISKLEKIDYDYSTARMTNLVAAWHLQLIEVMGAMGMREARRLRGDVGRAMFFEEIEEEIFGKLFGSRKA